jgi:hypothetical protein
MGALYNSPTIRARTPCTLLAAGRRDHAVDDTEHWPGILGGGSLSRQRDLRDSLHREMLDSKRGWSSEEIARTTLKIVSNPDRADKLVHAILGADPRFVRRGRDWHAGAASSPRLNRFSFLLSEARKPAGRDAAPSLFLCCYEPSSLRLPEFARLEPDGTGLERAASWLEGRLPVSLSAPATRRALHRLEQTHALPAASERLLDLQAALRVSGAGGISNGTAETTVEDAGFDPSDERDEEGEENGRRRLDACRGALDGLLDRRGESSLEEIEEEIERSQQAEAIDFSRFRFGREEIALLPVRPGVYRFIGDAGRLLYVGKSRDISRRVASYFRPLAAGHARRARLLAEVRDLEWETTPSELEALILEGETIRRERPLFNQQIELHPAGESTGARERDLAIVLCEGDEKEVSVFLLRDGRAWGRTRLPRGPGAEVERRAQEVAARWFSPEAGVSAGIEPIGEPEGLLVLRYLRLHRDRIDRLNATEAPDAARAGAALARLAMRERPAWEPWILRSPHESTT